MSAVKHAPLRITATVGTNNAGKPTATLTNNKRQA
jgi:hypothetical protein